jgi:hypothetical protein
MSSEPNVIAPKRGDHVAMAQQEGVFEVADINSLMQTANLNHSECAVDGAKAACQEITGSRKKWPERQWRPGSVHSSEAIFEE